MPDESVPQDGAARDDEKRGGRGFLTELLDRCANCRPSAWWVAFWFAAQISAGFAVITWIAEYSYERASSIAIVYVNSG